jgi:hypothetical protein
MSLRAIGCAMQRLTVRDVLALILVGAFVVAYFHYPAELGETLKNAFLVAVAYYLGSSKGAAENRDVLNEVAKRAGGVS